MLSLPQSTEFNKRVPKQKFNSNLLSAPIVRRAFTEQIKCVYWRNKLAATTLNLAAGEQVTEIEVFEVRLASSKLDESVLRMIDRMIPYHILFLLERNGKYQAVMGYKEAAASGKMAFKVDRYFHTEWMDEKELPLHLEGLTLDAVYENFIRQIAQTQSGVWCDECGIAENLVRTAAREQLERQIAVLKAKIRKEVQPKKKFEMASELKQLQEDVRKMGGR